jgi:hypothetical protein
MSGRRSHPRFAVATPWDGAVRVLRDVVVQRIAPNELLAVSQVAGLVGEEMSLDVIGGGASLGLRVRVLESAPMIFNGTVRHRLRLALLNGAGASPEADEVSRASAADSPAPAEM